MCRLGDHDATTLAASLSLSLSLSVALFRSHSVSLSLSSYLPLFLGVAAVCRESSSFTPAGHTLPPYLVCLPQLWLVSVALTISYVDHLPVLTFPTDLSNRMLLLYSMCSRW